MYPVRRSGRLANKRIEDQWNDDEEVIDLETPEWEYLNEEFTNDDPIGDVNVGQDMDDDFLENKKMERKDERVVLKEKLKALVNKRVNNKRGVGGKGKMEANDEESKKEEAKKGAGKRKKVVLCEKVKRTKAVDENGNNIGKNVVEGVGGSSDDDFVDSFVGKRGMGRKKMDDAFVKPKQGPGMKTKLDRIQLRNAPGYLFRVITQLTPRQKQDVRDIGFGDILDFKISSVPKELGYWLLDKFDADTCSLNINGRQIMITAEVVRNLLGVPMGEIHINARNSTDFRSQLARDFRAQFGTGFVRIYNSHVADLIAKKGSGWMFKINFLVLFFSTVGELNLSNTVNQKFLHCINTEDDIRKMDWCTYIVECLIKTKRSWKQGANYNGPIVLLLVLFAHSETPIKIWSTDMLKKLEADMLHKGDDSDTNVGEESKFEGEPSTPKSNNNVIEPVIGDAESVPQVGSYQPTPEGSKFWIPDSNNKPVEGTEFDTLELALKFYKDYARECGFEVRRGGQKQINKDADPTLKYFVCAKEGFKPPANNVNKKTDVNKNTDTVQSDVPQSEVQVVNKVINRRKRASQRCGCQAKLRIRRIKGNRWRVYEFLEKHNHRMVREEDYKYLKVNRKLTFPQQQLLYHLSNVNLGPTRSFKVMKEMYGGFENIGVTDVECRNYKRGLNNFIGKRDAQMVVEKLLSRQEFFDNFSVEFKQDKVDNTLVGLFWADDKAKQYFDAFGDVVSFDATFRSNRYNMILVPFTGIDNHNRCIIFGAALLAGESIKKYRWLLKRFKKIFGKAPKVVVTDQDPAMKVAIEQIFPDARHRLCMWHIMKKLAEKVGSDLCNDTNFKKRLCDIVWTDKIDPDDFESEWNSIMEDFKLNDHKWLADMFGMRYNWIPAYFRHEPMSGLMRTTSRSESENHFLGQLTNPDLTLVEFLSHYDTAIDAQRFKYGKNTHDSNYKSPDLKTHLQVEKEAAELYTITLFYDVQDEIWSSLYHCFSLSVQDSENFSTYIIRDTEGNSNKKIKAPYIDYEVKYVPSECAAECSCLRYECFGLLCSHIFYVLRMSNVHHFPKHYLQRRWSKNPMVLKTVDKTASQPNCEIDSVLKEIYSNVEQSVNHLVGDLEKLHLYKDAQKTLTEKAKTDVPNPPKMTTNAVYASTLGVTEPENVNILAPHGINNKGHRIRTRLKSKSEIAMKLSDKPKRLCGFCKKYSNHDSRNCPEKKKQFPDEDVDFVQQDDGDDMDMYGSD